MATKLVHHGWQWFFGTKDSTFSHPCPDCGRKGFTVKNYGTVGPDKEPAVWIECSSCGCVWEQTRDKEGECDASTDLR